MTLTRKTFTFLLKSVNLDLIMVHHLNSLKYWENGVEFRAYLHTAPKNIKVEVLRKG